ncbi:MAG: DUF5343 domain-containing protein [Ardenticatenaceae bacterium]|nr:DUF5343 domain-containing protein [Ardenticatenaceae bacterium]
MPTDFPYANVPTKLSELLNKISHVGVPDNVTLKWLESIGFKSSNDRNLVKVLAFIEFIDSSGTPTDFWKRYRGKNNKSVLAEAIRKGYSELYNIYPEAHQLSDTDLEHFFSTRSTAGKQVISRLVRTFKTLCDMSDFENIPTTNSRTSISDHKSEANPLVSFEQVSPAKKSIDPLSHIEPQFTFNIQVVLPENASMETYNNIFRSIAVHLLGRGSE